MVDLCHQNVKISPWRGLAQDLAGDLIVDSATNHFVMVDGVAIRSPEKNKIRCPAKKAAEQKPEPSIMPTSLESAQEYEHETENDHLFLDPKHRSGQQPSEKLEHGAVSLRGEIKDDDRGVDKQAEIGIRIE